MSRPNQRLDTTEASTAYRVASLLRQPPPSGSRDSDTHSLRSMTSQIEQFLTMAPQVPAVRMEPEWTTSGEDGNEEEEDEALRRSGQPVVQLNVVAGVLEETDPADHHAGMARLGGVLLPTAETQQELHRRKAEQAQAMLNLMSALAPSGSGSPLGQAVRRDSGIASLGAGESNANLSTRVQRHPSSNSDDDEVAVMDADDLNDEDTSDEDMPVQRRRIQEMN